MRTEFDCTIVGAGIVGLAAALRLQLDGLRIALVERDEPAAGCSSGNAGYLSLGNVFPLAAPGVLRSLPRMLLDREGPLVVRPTYLPRLVPWGLRFLAASRSSRFESATQALLRLTAPAIRAYDRLLEAADAREIIQRRGGLHVYDSHSALHRRLALRSLFAAHDIEIRALTAHEVRDLEPALRGEFAGAVFFPASVHCVNPRRLGERLAHRILAGGGELFRTHAGSLRQLERGWEVHTAAGPIRTSRVLVSAGRWSDELLTPLGLRVPLEAERGYHLMLPQTDIGLGRPIVLAEKHFVVSPMEHGVRLAGTVEFAHRSAPPNPARADMLFAQAAAVLPALRHRDATRWMGQRPTLPDSLPAIGTSARHTGLFYSFAHQHCGLTLAAVSADLIADLVAGREPTIDPRPYSLERFRH